jgi:uncharacterized protein YjiS (DUF1127 family)
MAKAHFCGVSHILARQTELNRIKFLVEGAMSTMILEAMIGRPHRGLRWSEVTQRLVEWRHRARSRNELMGLSDRCLQDIGISRCTANFEASKPFWMA